jgi:hypothetical protein
VNCYHRLMSAIDVSRVCGLLTTAHRIRPTEAPPETAIPPRDTARKHREQNLRDRDYPVRLNHRLLRCLCEPSCPIGLNNTMFGRRGNYCMSDASGRRDIRAEDSLGADGLQGFPKETGTERSEVEDRGFKSHPRRFPTNHWICSWLDLI